MQLSCLYGAGAIKKNKKKTTHSNPVGKGMFVAVYRQQKAGVSDWEKGGARTQNLSVVGFFFSLL